MARPLVLAEAPSRAVGGAISPAGAARHAFVELDDQLLDPGSTGALSLRLLDPNTGPAVAAHVRRRALEHGRTCVGVASPPGTTLWREVALRAGLGVLASDAETAARSLLAALTASSSIVVGRLAPDSEWDARVATELGRLVLSGASQHPSDRAGALIVLLAGESEVLPVPWQVHGPFSIVCPTLVWDGSLDELALDRWWGAIATDGRSHTPQGSLPRLDAWWTHASRSAQEFDLSRVTAPTCDVADVPLHARLELAQRAWPVSKLGAFATVGSLSRLEAAGVVKTSLGQVVLLAPVVGRTDGESAADARAVALALEDVFPRDPWAHARAGALLALAGDPAGAEVAHVRGIAAAEDVAGRTDLWLSWGRVVESLAPALRHGCQLRASALALSLGDADAATSWAERAEAGVPNDVGALLLLGKASLSRGDLTSASVTLERALATATTPVDRANAEAELAEVAYASGDMSRAQELANKTLRSPAPTAVLLGARNTLGKLLLAKAKWSAAEAHFAEDAVTAACAGDVPGRLRATLNRAIAALSAGRSADAEPMMNDVLEEAQRRGDIRALAFALSNLAVIATNRHDYGTALELSERAIAARRKLGERLGLARVIANLAELRLRLGLVAEADQTLAFGRASISRTGSAPRAAHLALVAARIALARGDTVTARREAQAAVAGAGGSSDGDMSREVMRLQVRIALEDGDISEAERALAAATAGPTGAGSMGAGPEGSPVGTAEGVLLEASIARALGRGALPIAREALALAQRALDEELLREAHTLVALVTTDPADRARHVTQAAALRNAIADSLNPTLQQSFLARRDLQVLAELERQHLTGGRPPVGGTSAEGPLAPPSSRSSRKATAFVGSDPSFLSLLGAIRKVGKSDTTVLILGESGTGKELVAEALHDASARRDAPLVKVNCAALVESLLLSELFGHEKGAFTGAVGRKRGRFEMAEGGTLFLDEIGDISPGTQVALLRVLQERTFERVGGTTEIVANTRVVCATHRDLPAMVDRGEFRQDLYFRLSAITLQVPSLRARTSDLPTLVAALLDRIGGERNEAPKTVSGEAMALLARHRWPGNVRELENALRAASLFADSDIITPLDLVSNVEGLRNSRSTTFTRDSSAGTSSTDGDAASSASEGGDATSLVYADIKAGKLGLFDLKRKLERECIVRALAETNGNITRAATILGMKRPRLSQLVKQYGLAVASEGF